MTGRENVTLWWIIRRLWWIMQSAVLLTLACVATIDNLLVAGIAVIGINPGMLAGAVWSISRELGWP